MRLPLLILLLASLGASATAAEKVLLPAANPVASLVLPDGWTKVHKDGVTVLFSPEKTPHIELWPLAPGVPGIAEAVAQAPTLITGYVKEFAAASRTDLTIAGRPAVRLTGTGVEADDGDPSQAEVTFFSVADGTVLVCLAHGEGDGTAKRREALAGILATVAAVP